MPHRKRRRRHEIIGHARLITFSCYQRLQLLATPLIRDHFVRCLETVRTRRRFALHAWVVMPEHVHLMITPDLPSEPVRRVLADLKGSFSSMALRRWRQLDAPILERLSDRHGRLHFWQTGGGYDLNLHSPKVAIEKVEYIHANPERRGLVDTPSEWRWSSARWYEGLRGDDVPAIDELSVV